jgi:hypothetical protein
MGMIKNPPNFEIEFWKTIMRTRKKPL